MRRLIPLALAGSVLATPAAALAGTSWVWPLAPPHRVVTGFDLPSEAWLPGHRGVDLAGHVGEVVRAAGAGVVRFAGRVAHIGVVSITHSDGLVTTYQPVAAVVHRGEPVRAGQPIGRLLLAGRHCAAACLHWGLLRGADYLDPLALVGAGLVRLLPLGSAGLTAPAPLVAPASGAVLAAGGLMLSRRRRRRR